MREQKTGNTGIVKEIVLTENKKTRRVIRATIKKENSKTSEANVKLTIIHQKNVSGEWEDEKGKPLSSLKAGEMMQMNLCSEETLNLFKELKNLYDIHIHTDNLGENEVVSGFDNEIIKSEPCREKLVRELVGPNMAATR